MRVGAVLGVFATALVFGLGVASASMMHPKLGGRLVGMGEHGVVNITVSAHDLCWTFDVPTRGPTTASIRDAHEMAVVRLGTRFAVKGCAMASTKVIKAIDESPSKYWVWLNTKGHPGDLRGKLFVGIAHM